MKIHEYQAKSLLAKLGLDTSRGQRSATQPSTKKVARTPRSARSARTPTAISRAFGRRFFDLHFLQYFARIEFRA